MIGLDANPPSLVLQDIYKRSYGIYRSNPHIFIPLGLIYGFASVVSQNLFLWQQNAVFLIFFIQIAIHSLASVIIIDTTYRIENKMEVRSSEWGKLLREKYFLYLGVLFLKIMFIFLGLIAFILPAFYFITIFLFADITVVLAYRGIQSSFKESMQLVHPYLGKIFLFVFLFISLGMFFPLLAYVLLEPLSPVLSRAFNVVFSALFPPYIFIATTVLYLELKELMRDFQQEMFI